MYKLFIFFMVLSAPMFPQATQVPAASGSGTVTAGTGILVAGSEVSIDTAVTQKLSVGQSGSPLYCASGSASATTYTCALTPTLTAYTAGMTVAWKVDTSCTGSTATTLNIDSLGAKSITEADGSTDPVSGDCPANRQVTLRYDGTLFRIVGGGTSSSGNVVSTSQEGYLFPFDMNGDINNTIAASNETFYVQFVSPISITVSKIFVYQAANGVGASSGMAMALYNQAGNLLQQTDTLDPTTGGAVRKTFTLAASVTLQASTVYYIAFSCSCSTSPGMYQGVANSSTMRLLLNWDTNPRLFYANDTTGTTTLTFPATIGTRTVQSIYPIGVMFVP